MNQLLRNGEQYFRGLYGCSKVIITDRKSFEGNIEKLNSDYAFDKMMYICHQEVALR